ncbi:hypothetical protein [Marinococcus sp. PL1-022]|uniref:hypothetical protein n=1 Tax=Marinococcus sp. PL1-022 TaxID=3095363 RepID=UPI0029C139C6|nr:hypothetical protein [Marinococcus sp. PL1-022]MDX6152861.1 hypothetical protein [Marinococcus sp. PL1-022]
MNKLKAFTFTDWTMLALFAFALLFLVYSADASITPETLDDTEADRPAEIVYEQEHPVLKDRIGYQEEPWERTVTFDAPEQ